MALSYLENLERTKEALRMEPGSPFERIAKEFAEATIAVAKNKLSNGSPAHESTGALASSIAFAIKFGEVIEIDFLMNYYWDFINSGVDGVERSTGATPNAEGQIQRFKTINPSPQMVDAFVGVGSLDGWIRAKGINQLIYTNQFGERIVDDLVTDDDYRQAAYVFARGVKKKGIIGNHFIDETFDEEAIQKLENDILDEIEKLL